MAAAAEAAPFAVHSLVTVYMAAVCSDERYTVGETASTACGATGVSGPDSNGHMASVMVNGTARARADAGSLGVYLEGVTATTGDYPFGGSVGADLRILALAEFSDPLTLLNAPLAGLLRIHLLIDGDQRVDTASYGPNVYSDVDSLAFINSQDVYEARGSATVSERVGYDLPFAVPYEGYPVELHVMLGTSLVCANLTQPGDRCGGVSDFFRTLAMSHIEVLDSAGSPTRGRVVSASGFDYNNLQPVPEPASFVLIAAGMVGLILRRARTFVR